MNLTHIWICVTVTAIRIQNSSIIPKILLHATPFLKKKFIYLFIYLSIYGCVGSSFLCEGFL